MSKCWIFHVSNFCPTEDLTWDCCVCSNAPELLFSVIKVIDAAVIKTPLKIKADVFLIPTPLTPAVVYLILIPAFLIPWMLFYSLKIIAYACALN